MNGSSRLNGVGHSWCGRHVAVAADPWYSEIEGGQHPFYKGLYVNGSGEGCQHNSRGFLIFYGGCHRLDDALLFPWVVFGPVFQEGSALIVCALTYKGMHLRQLMPGKVFTTSGRLGLMRQNGTLDGLCACIGMPVGWSCVLPVNVNCQSDYQTVSGPTHGSPVIRLLERRRVRIDFSRSQGPRI